MDLVGFHAALNPMPQHGACTELCTDVCASLRNRIIATVVTSSLVSFGVGMVVGAYGILGPPPHVYNE
jgi:hypothetical protein